MIQRRKFLPGTAVSRTVIRLCLLITLFAIAGCRDDALNNPYPGSEREANILYTSFSERPKHLDPARSYSSNEYALIANIYEPPLQYHFLKRPYTLVPLAAAEMPQMDYLDEHGELLPEGSPEPVAYSRYRIRIREGIRYQPHPALARLSSGDYRYHQVSEEDMVGIHAIGDFRFSDSRELVAADYVYQIKRLALPQLHSPILGLMRQYIAGMDEFAKRMGAFSENHDGAELFRLLDGQTLDGVQATGRYTYEIKVKGRYPQLKYWLAMPFFAPMPPEADQFYQQERLTARNISLDWYPVGTGPYLLSLNNPNRKMELIRNPNFHSEFYPEEGEDGDRAEGYLDDAGRRLPFIDRVVFSREKESIPYWNKFLQGYYDTSPVASDSFDQALQVSANGEFSLTDSMKGKDIQLRTAVAASVYYMGFNMLDPVVGGLSERTRKLRQALSIAVDYEEYISIFLNGRGIAAQGPLPPGIYGYESDATGINTVIYDWRKSIARRKSITEARRLLAEAGYPDGREAGTGKPLMLHLDATGSGPDEKARMDWFRKQFTKLGVQLDVRNTDYNRFQEKMRKGTAQLFQWGWNADYPDPENFMFLLYGPNGKVEHGGENAANYANPGFDRRFEKMKNMPNGPERLRLIREMLDIVRQDSPWFWGINPKTVSLHHAWYFNSKPNLMANNTLKYKRIDPSMRLQAREDWNRPVFWPVGIAALVFLLFLVPVAWTYLRRDRFLPARPLDRKAGPL